MFFHEEKIQLGFDEILKSLGPSLLKNFIFHFEIFIKDDILYFWENFCCEN